VVGFTNAGALIIATSQLGKLFGISVPKAEHHYETVQNTLLAAMEHTHIPTLVMGILAIVIILGLKKFYPKWPGVLMAVVVTTLISWMIGFEENGGGVVGAIPQGLPAITIPEINMDVIKQLITSAVVIALIGFMEAIAIAKAMAAKTRQRLDTNQELVGQGLSNVVAGMFGGYPVSGSFSRSAVNIEAGALTGFSSVVTGAVVGLTLLFLTPLLYHLPTATLGVVIILAVINLIKVAPVIHAWKAQPQDAVVLLVTFFLTLYLAPHLEGGILTGVVLSLLLFIVRSMRPRVAVLSRYKDGSMRDVSVHPLPTSDLISLIRFDGSLYFANAGYFEDKVLEEMASKPDLRYIIVDASAINQLDATGEEVLHHLAERLNANNIELVVSGMKKQFMDVIRRTRLIDYLQEDHFFAYTQQALDYVWDSLGDEYDRSQCPLRQR
jgi:SulP family sulfate permease